MYNEYSMVNEVNAPIDLRDRTLESGKLTIKFVTILQNSITRPIINQLIRSSTSIGAKYIEAKNASSKRDYRNEVFISKKEASVTLYWLKLTEDFINNQLLKNLQKKCQEIILILQKIINTLGH